MSKRRVKEIERNFTLVNARKDVIYKAVIRFFKRTCQLEFKGLLDGELKNDYEENRERARVYLEERLGLGVSEDLIQTLFILVGIKTSKLNSFPKNSSLDKFKTQLRLTMERFNVKKLSHCFEHKEFSTLFQKFWERQGLFEEMVENLNSKRLEAINEEAHKYYLKKLISLS